MPPKKRKAKTSGKKSGRTLRRRFNLKDGGRPLQAIDKGLGKVVKSGVNVEKAAKVQEQVQDVIKTLSSICDLNRWTVDV